MDARLVYIKKSLGDASSFLMKAEAVSGEGTRVLTPAISGEEPPVTGTAPTAMVPAVGPFAERKVSSVLPPPAGGSVTEKQTAIPSSTPSEPASPVLPSPIKPSVVVSPGGEVHQFMTTPQFGRDPWSQEGLVRTSPQERTELQTWMEGSRGAPTPSPKVTTPQAFEETAYMPGAEAATAPKRMAVSPQATQAMGTAHQIVTPGEAPGPTMQRPLVSRMGEAIRGKLQSARETLRGTSAVSGEEVPRPSAPVVSGGEAPRMPAPVMSGASAGEVVAPGGYVSGMNIGGPAEPFIKMPPEERQRAQAGRAAQEEGEAPEIMRPSFSPVPGATSGAQPSEKTVGFGEKTPGMVTPGMPQPVSGPVRSGQTGALGTTVVAPSEPPKPAGAGGAAAPGWGGTVGGAGTKPSLPKVGTALGGTTTTPPTAGAAGVGTPPKLPSMMSGGGMSAPKATEKSPLGATPPLGMPKVSGGASAPTQKGLNEMSDDMNKGLLIGPGLGFGMGHNQEDDIHHYIGTPFEAKAHELCARKCRVKADLNDIPWSSIFDSKKKDPHEKKRKELQDKMRKIQSEWMRLHADMMEWSAKELRKEDDTQKSLNAEEPVEKAWIGEDLNDRLNIFYGTSYQAQALECLSKEQDLEAKIRELAPMDFQGGICIDPDKDKRKKLRDKIDECQAKFLKLQSKVLKEQAKAQRKHSDKVQKGRLPDYPHKPWPVAQKKEVTPMRPYSPCADKEIENRFRGDEGTEFDVKFFHKAQRFAELTQKVFSSQSGGE